MPPTSASPISSLRFRPIAAGASHDRGNRSALIYRATVERNGDAPADSDLQTIGDGGLRLRLREELGGRRADRTQFGAGEDFDEEAARSRAGCGSAAAVVDCELAWEIESADIWSRDRTADWSLTVTVRLHWHESIAPGEVTKAPASRSRPAPRRSTTSTRACWRRPTSPSTRRAMRSSRGKLAGRIRSCPRCPRQQPKRSASHYMARPCPRNSRTTASSSGGVPRPPTTTRHRPGGGRRCGSPWRSRTT